MAPVIDAHTHAFPQEVIDNREHYCDRDDWFKLLYQEPKAKLTGATELLVSMDRTGIERSIIAGFPWADSGLCREHNAWMAEVCSENPERLSYLGIVSPSDPSAAQDASDAIAAGAAGIGELNADAQQFAIDDPTSTADLVEICGALEKPLMFHASEPLGHDYPGKGTATPDKLVAWLTAFPDQPVVFAHWGGGLPFYELMPEVRAATANAVYDCAATTYLYDFGVFRSVLNIVGPERILFGSDFPVLGQHRLVPRVRRAVDKSHHGALFSANARRVYGIEAGETQ